MDNNTETTTTAPTERKRLPSLDGITLDQIASGLDTDLFTCVDLTRAYIRRIKEVNNEYKAVIEINPEAEAIAQKLDEEMVNSGRRGPFHGVPIIVKDSIMVNGMNCSSGSLAFMGARTAKEATVASRLRAAGAVILATANNTELNNFRASLPQRRNGWSPRGGTTRGVFHPNQTPLGSSAGSAVATRIGLSFAALGVETCGNIITPSRMAATVAIKPTPGLTPRDAVTPVAQSYDTVGPMARTVKAAAALLAIIAGSSDEKHPAMHRCPFPTKRAPRYVAACGKGYRPRLNGLRIGAPRAARRKADCVDALGTTYDDVIALLRDLGAEVVDNIEMDCWGKIDFDHEFDELLNAEFRDSISKFCSSLSVNPNKIRNIDDLIAYIRTTPGENLAEMNIDELLGAAKAPAIDDPAFLERKARIDRMAGPEGVWGMMDKHRLDALVFDDAFPSGMMYLPITIAGAPVISIPLGFYPDGTSIDTDTHKRLSRAPGLPFCTSFSARPFKEEVLIKIGHAVEQAWTIRGYAEPYMEPKAELKDVMEKK